MLKTLAFAAAATLVGSAAIAQGPPAIKDWNAAPQPPGSVIGPRSDDPAYIRFEKDLQKSLDARMRAQSTISAADLSSDVSATVPIPPPASWTGSESAWGAHLRACVAQYKTYDPATDMFYSKPGVKSRCRL